MTDYLADVRKYDSGADEAAGHDRPSLFAPSSG